MQRPPRQEEVWSPTLRDQAHTLTTHTAGFFVAQAFGLHPCLTLCRVTVLPAAEAPEAAGSSATAPVAEESWSADKTDKTS